LLPSVVPPTLAPAPSATLAPPTAVPPTAVPPTAVPPTAVPPTAVPPTAVPPTVVPPAGGAVVDLVALAPSATWRTNEGRVSFGRPFLRADRGGWAASGDATLEDGQQYQGLLVMVPPELEASQPLSATVEPYIEGEYQLPALQQGQILVGAVGFAKGVASQSVTVTITFEGQLLYQGGKQPDGLLLPISVDMSPYGGQAGRLTLRVSGPGSSSPAGLYWVRPRIDIPR
ncbi:MAG: hypothetical protein HGA45_36785, partial [Chloroflexales bacterium]|nr:hypothetical protein [Chloroflexales bacterium]